MFNHVWFSLRRWSLVVQMFTLATLLRPRSHPATRASVASVKRQGIAARATARIQDAAAIGHMGQEACVQRGHVHRERGASVGRCVGAVVGNGLHAEAFNPTQDPVLSS